MKRLATDSGQRSQKWDTAFATKRRKEKYYEQEDDYAEDSEQNEPGEFEGSPFMRLALHDIERYMLLDSQGPDASIPTKAKAGQPLPLRSGSRLNTVWREVFAGSGTVAGSSFAPSSIN